MVSVFGTCDTLDHTLIKPSRRKKEISHYQSDFWMHRLCLCALSEAVTRSHTSTLQFSTRCYTHLWHSRKSQLSRWIRANAHTSFSPSHTLSKKTVMGTFYTLGTRTIFDKKPLWYWCFRGICCLSHTL